MRQCRGLSESRFRGTRCAKISAGAVVVRADHGQPGSLHRQIVLCCWILLTFFAFSGSASAQRFIELGISDAFAAGQPVVSVEVFRDSAGTSSLGPSSGTEFFVLDTGANGILMDGNAFASVSSAGYETVSVYDEQGVAGFTPMDVSESYRFDYTDTDGAPLTIQNARIMSNPELDFGSTAGFFGLVGMPGMVNRTVSMDFTGEWSSFGGELGLGTFSPPVTFSDAPPPGEGHRYHVPLRLQEFPQSGLRNPEDPPPTWAPLPFAPVNLNHFGKSFTGELLVDTGAQMSILSTETALALGLDENGNGSFFDEAVLTVEVGGVGGTVEMPVLAVQSGAVLTDEGVELRWNELAVGVLDIDPSIPGIFGMNFLTEGWTDKLLGDLLCELFPEFCGEEIPDGYFSQAHFDFREASNLEGKLVVDLRADLDVVRSFLAGDLNDDGQVNADDVHWLVMALTNPPTYASHFPDVDRQARGDLNGDGRFDNRDLSAMGRLLSAPQASVPEPATWLLAMLSAGCAPWVTGRRRG